MSHSNHNQVSPSRPKRIAIVLSNPAVSTTTGWPVGFWWSELTHPYFSLTEAGYRIDLHSPDGGTCEADAMSNPEDASQWQADDVISRGYLHDPDFLDLINTTRPVEQIDTDSYDAIVVIGGQSPMFSFATATHLHTKFVEFFELGKLTCALCHGTAVLRYATLSNGELLVAGKTVTGFANVEEDFADTATRQAGAIGPNQTLMPWRIEDELRKAGANFVQAGLFKPFAIRDGNLLTGQQNFSGGEVAKLILEALGR
jgi:putative intracellular protease/amidase